MRSKLGLVLLASTLAGCAYTPQGVPDAGVAAINTPVVSRADYVLDASAPGGTLAPNEAARLDAWFQSLEVRYGDRIHVDAPYYSPAAQADIQRIAGQYGLMVSPGAPVTTGPVPSDMVRVIVSRTVATVPGCPNWDRPSQPNYNNQMMPNFGCAVNTNLAAMVANPEDLIHGREGSGVADTLTTTRAVRSYREAVPTGTRGLQDVNTTRKGDQ